MTERYINSNAERLVANNNANGQGNGPGNSIDDFYAGLVYQTPNGANDNSNSQSPYAGLTYDNNQNQNSNSGDSNTVSHYVIDQRYGGGAVAGGGTLSRRYTGARSYVEVDSNADTTDSSVSNFNATESEQGGSTVTNGGTDNLSNQAPVGPGQVGTGTNPSRADFSTAEEYIEYLKLNDLDPTGDGRIDRRDGLYLIDRILDGPQGGNRTGFEARFDQGFYDFNGDGVTDLENDLQALANYIQGEEIVDTTTEPPATDDTNTQEPETPSYSKPSDFASLAEYLQYLSDNGLDPKADGVLDDKDLRSISNYLADGSGEQPFLDRVNSGLYDFNEDGVTDIQDKNILSEFFGPLLKRPSDFVNLVQYFEYLKENRLDPTGDGEIFSRDALAVIDHLNDNNLSVQHNIDVPDDFDPTAQELSFLQKFQLALYDFNEDGKTDAVDKQIIIDYLNGVRDFATTTNTDEVQQPSTGSSNNNGQANNNQQNQNPPANNNQQGQNTGNNQNTPDRGNILDNSPSGTRGQDDDDNTNTDNTNDDANNNNQPQYSRPSDFDSLAEYIEYLKRNRLDPNANSEIDNLDILDLRNYIDTGFQVDENSGFGQRINAGLYDFNEDGRLDNENDVQVLVDYLFETGQFTPPLKKVTDFATIDEYIEYLAANEIDPNDDGNISGVDSLRMVNYINGDALSDDQALSQERLQRFEAGLYDFNNDGQTDTADRAILDDYINRHLPPTNQNNGNDDQEEVRGGQVNSTPAEQPTDNQNQQEEQQETENVFTPGRLGTRGNVPGTWHLRTGRASGGATPTALRNELQNETHRAANYSNLDSYFEYLAESGHGPTGNNTLGTADLITMRNWLRRGADKASGSEHFDRRRFVGMYDFNNDGNTNAADMDLLRDYLERNGIDTSGI